jgi:hypothetical protein
VAEWTLDDVVRILDEVAPLLTYRAHEGTRHLEPGHTPSSPMSSAAGLAAGAGYPAAKRTVHRPPNSRQ